MNGFYRNVSGEQESNAARAGAKSGKAALNLLLTVSLSCKAEKDGLKRDFVWTPRDD